MGICCIHPLNWGCDSHNLSPSAFFYQLSVPQFQIGLTFRLQNYHSSLLIPINSTNTGRTSKAESRLPLNSHCRCCYRSHTLRGRYQIVVSHRFRCPGTSPSKVAFDCPVSTETRWTEPKLSRRLNPAHAPWGVGEDRRSEYSLSSTWPVTDNLIQSYLRHFVRTDRRFRARTEWVTKLDGNRIWRFSRDMSAPI